MDASCLTKGQTTRRKQSLRLRKNVDSPGMRALPGTLYLSDVYPCPRCFRHGKEAKGSSQPLFETLIKDISPTS